MVRGVVEAVLLAPRARFVGLFPVMTVPALPDVDLPLLALPKAKFLHVCCRFLLLPSRPPTPLLDPLFLALAVACVWLAGLRLAVAFLPGALPTPLLPLPCPLTAAAQLHSLSFLPAVAPTW